jgi:hypothetical protein
VSSEVGYEKPSPEIFKAALSKDLYTTSSVRKKLKDESWKTVNNTLELIQSRNAS